MKKIMKKALFIFICFMCMNSLSGMLKWPLSNPVITSNVFESRHDHWHNGIDIIAGTELELKSPGNGEVIFYYDETETPMPDNFGAGNYLVLEHANNKRTLHYHLEAGTVIKNKTRVNGEDIIGLIGNSGRSLGPHLHMTLYDSRTNNILNPIDFFPSIEDVKKPVIKKILLKPPMSSAINILKRKRLRKKNNFRVIVMAYDVREGPKYMKAPLGVRSVELYLDGRLIKKVDFSYLQLLDNRYCLNGDRDVNFNRLYIGSPYYIDIAGIHVNKKKHKIRIIVKDQVGNVSKKSVTVTFY